MFRLATLERTGGEGQWNGIAKKRRTKRKEVKGKKRIGKKKRKREKGSGTGLLKKEGQKEKK